MVEPAAVVRRVTDAKPTAGLTVSRPRFDVFRAVKHALFTMSSITADLVFLDALVSEAERYLATVDYFRRQGCEPRWSGERTHAQTTLVDTEPLLLMDDDEFSLDDRL